MYELAQAPIELTRGRLQRLGEGIGKVVYASDHWVVKRERTPFEVVALIVIWRGVRRVERILPGDFAARLISKPSRQIRLLRVVTQALLALVPKALWFSGHIRRVWTGYQLRSRRGERLAQEHLQGTNLTPGQITFPPVRVKVGGWPGSLLVSEATERVDATLDVKLHALATAGRFDELELWLERLLETRQSGWRRGLFSMDAHLKNFGVIEDRVVLLDPGGLTNRWTHVENQLLREEKVDLPHVRMGLGEMLASRPDVAERFNSRWKSAVNRAALSELWPES